MYDLVQRIIRVHEGFVASIVEDLPNDFYESIDGLFKKLVETPFIHYFYTAHHFSP